MNKKILKERTIEFCRNKEKVEHLINSYFTIIFLIGIVFQFLFNNNLRYQLITLFLITPFIIIIPSTILVINKVKIDVLNSNNLLMVLLSVDAWIILNTLSIISVIFILILFFYDSLELSIAIYIVAGLLIFFLLIACLSKPISNFFKKKLKNK